MRLIRIQLLEARHRAAGVFCRDVASASLITLHTKNLYKKAIISVARV
jgi:hypothetical protein